MKYNCIAIILLLSLMFNQKCFAQDKKNNVLENYPIDTAIVFNKNDTNLEHNSDCIDILHISQKKSSIITISCGIKIWKLKDGSIDTIISFGDSMCIDKLVVSHDEEKIIASVNCFNGKKDFICCYSLPNKQLLWKVEDVKFDNGLGVSMGDSLVYAIGSWTVTTLNVNTGTIVKKDRKFMRDCLLPNWGGIKVLFSPSGHYALYWKIAEFKTFNLRFGSRLKVWDLLNDKMVASKFIKGKGVWSASFLSDEKNILTGSFDGKLRLWSLEKNKIIKSYQIYNNDNVFYNNSRTRCKKRNCIYQTILPKDTENFLGTYGLVDGKWAFKIWRYAIMKAEKLFLYTGFCSSAFTNDGKYFIISHEGYLCLYETGSWKLLWRVPIIRENKKEK